ncbi:MAG: ribokinase [Vicinamibacterales bacterium]|jgi:ribokinase|nr:ribokinase [Vicinamibacterales bacterium]MDP6609542.1 ribokinase [Vicinamibacterales bacterium]|tara:strand:- start:2172 stop:3104 length:933 start_codon:yes stop_codon:yes gene_type:complete
MASPRIVVVGSANVDLTTFVDTFPRPGETVFADRFDLGFGGKGANQAVAARLCGAEVEMVARVGDDLFGPATLEHLDSLGVGVTHVRSVANVSSGVAPIFVDPSGQNRILVVPGANGHLLPDDVNLAEPLIRRADVLVLQLEVPLETVYHAVGVARAHGVRCILNPAPGQPLDLSKVSAVDYFIPNETEAEAIAGRSVKTVADAEDCARGFVAEGFRTVVVTLGEQGAVMANAEAATRVSPFPVVAKDTTGAGDAFIGSLAVFLAEGAPEAEALARASLYAALSTTEIGTQKAFASRQTFEAEWTRRARG